MTVSQDDMRAPSMADHRLADGVIAIDYILQLVLFSEARYNPLQCVH